MRTSNHSSFWNQVRSTVIGPVVIVPLAASAVLLAATGAAGAGTTTIASTLGAAGPGNSVSGFAVLALGGTSTSGLNCSATLDIGNVGVGGPDTFSNASSCIETGNVYLASTATVTGGGTVKGKTITSDALLSQAVSDAQSASSTFAAMAATDTSVTSLTGGSYTFTATQSGINVVDLSSLSAGPRLSFSCGSFKGCQWVVNDAGAFQFGGVVTLGKGMTSSDVLFNVYSHGASISFKPVTIGSGIFLAPYSSYQMNGAWSGEVIGGLNGTLTLHALAITAPEPVTEVPISGPTGVILGLVLLAAALTTAQWYRRRRTQAAA